MFKKLKDPVSGLTHLLGALLSVVGLVVLIYFALDQGSVRHVVAFSIFGSSLILLYSASTIYHLLRLSERGATILRKIDHMMIYFLIAGTYTPICLIPLQGGWGRTLLISIWALAITGMILKLFWLHAPRWLSTSFYLVMGWLVAVAFWPLLKTVPLGGVVWMVAGGMFYTIGAVIYGMKRPNLIPGWFGFHEIFHLFVMAGSFSHFWLMFKYINTLS